MGRRQIQSRYRGSMLGVLWSVFQPIVMLAIYTFVFGYVFQMRGGSTAVAGEISFPEYLFTGLLVHSVLAEALSNAPRLIISNENLVKRVVFPLELLPWASMIATVFHALISLAVLLTFFVILHWTLNWTVIFVPVVMLPLIILAVGVCWLFATIGVFIRDISEITNVLTTLLLFGCPIFYSMSQLPEQFQQLLYLNPLTFIVIQMRQIVLFGGLPHWAGLAAYTLVSVLVAWICFLIFQKARRGFADVI